MLDAARIAIDIEADAAYVTLLEGAISRTEEVAPGVAVDYAADGRPLGVEVLSIQARVGPGDPPSYLRGLVEGLLTPRREAAE